jgi:hypothetical protein
VPARILYAGALHQLDLLLLRDNDSLSKTPQNGVATVLGMSISP